MTDAAAKLPFSLDDGNWIAVWRQLRDSWIWQEPDKLRAWLDILMMANFEDGTFHFKGHPYQMKRGQTACTIRGLSERWQWDRKRVRTFLEQLAGDHAVVISYPTFEPVSKVWRDHKSPHGFCLLTVVRYPLKAHLQIADATDAPTNDPTTAPTNGTTNAPYLRTLKKKQEKTCSPEARALTQTVVDIWNEDRPQAQHVRVTDKRVAHVSARLDDGFTPEQITEIVRKLKASAWHQGKNERGWKAGGPEWALKSTEKAEEWASKQIEQAKPRSGYVPRV